MTRTLTPIVLALAAIAAAPAHAEFNANIEFDNTWQNQDRGLQQSGRVEFNAFAKSGASGFIAGKASYLALKSGAAAVDDMWVQVGNATGDVKLGRFEAADLFPLPRDVIVSSVGNVYRTNVLRGRTGSNIFHGAGTLNLGAGLSFELGVVETEDTSVNKGVRPVLTYEAGPLTVKLGAEAIEYAAATTGGKQEKQTGMGLSAAYKAGDFTFIGNFASAKTATDDKQSTVGLIASADSGLTVGVISGKTAEVKTQIAYLAYSMPLMDIKGASWTPAISTAKTDGAAENDNGFKIRFNYAF
jgi:hypothetical protein